MVVAKHIGRLGNNMFQIAASIGYAKRFGYQWAADSGSGVGEPYSSIHRVFPNLPKGEPYGGIRYHEHPNAFCRVHNQHYDQCHFNYHPIPDQGPNLSLTGFYQSWKYFENAQEEVKELFKLQHYPEMEGYVSIHVRRGDYVQHAGSFPPIDINYLSFALHGSLDTKQCMVFSDDIDWCKRYIPNHFSHITFEFSEGRSEAEDLARMASCSHHIIANSTYSWFGAYLGHNPDRKVISPSHKRPHWFGNTAGVRQDCIDLIPEGWIEIEWNK